MNFLKMFSASMLAWIVGIVGIFVFAIGSLVSSLLNMNMGEVGIKEESVLYINIGEPITDAPSSSPLSGFDPMSMSVTESLSLLKVLTAIEQAATDDNIKGICIYADGVAYISPATIEELRNALNRFKKSGKFIVAYDYNYSQTDYYLASVADKIILNPEGSLDWYGCATSLMFYKGAFDKLGIGVEIFRPTACKYKSAVEPFFLTKMSDANRKQNQEMVDSIWQSLCEDVAASRNISVETLKNYAANLAVSFPEEALKAGMIDAVEQEDYLFALYDNYGVKRNENGLFNTTTLAEYVSSINTSHLSTSVGNSKSLEFETSPIVAIIYAEGQIFDGNEYEDGSVYGSRLAKELRDARLNDAIKSVVVRVNSPGGSAIASELAWREMTLLQQVKPVVISMGEMAASGGYYISAPADYIFSDKTTLTGSIGVFGMIPNIKNLLTYRLGITIDNTYTSPAALTPSPFQPVTDIQRKNLNKSVDKVYETFTQHVAEGRNLDINDVLNIAEGRVWSGTMAKEIGLVDAIGGFNEAVGKAIELADISSNYKICEYVAPLTPFEEYLNSMSFAYTKSLGLDYNIYGDEMRDIISEIPMVFTYSGIQTRVVGDLKIEF
ncbi:MAG: signal peptide peptidase SppA [Alistipes sp.]|nr:signal peptide peptidase SppA [Alistipes sp.]